MYIEAAIPADRTIPRVPKLSSKFADNIPAPRAGAIGSALNLM